jgi:hypothetical protein
MHVLAVGVGWKRGGMQSGLVELLRWAVLGAAAGIVLARVAFMLWRAVGVIFPLAVMFGGVGWIAGGFTGCAIGVAVSSLIGLFVGR